MNDAKAIEKQIKEILDLHFWPPSLKGSVPYYRVHDDSGGDKGQVLSVTFGNDGDAWLGAYTSDRTVRFRTHGGGGHSPRVRTALMILALAIEMDNEESPQS